MTVSRTEALTLATTAYELGADVLRGRLEGPTEGSHWMLGDTDLDEWLGQYGNQELILIVAPVGPKPSGKQVCGRCGNEYTGRRCPHCHEVQQRLRGRK